uniref:POP5 homolog, ribonuclease P/MRP subunit n=1 Tax=Anas platyrhynchos TaxID=8839 RepID=A0A8B9SN87_ANAPL
MGRSLQNDRSQGALQPPASSRQKRGRCRPRTRYVLCQVVAEEPRGRSCIEERAVGSAVKDAIARAYGDYGLACCSLAFTVKYLNAYTGTVLLRCRKDFYRLLCSALPLVRQLESRGLRCPCFLSTLHVGGEPWRERGGHCASLEVALIKGQQPPVLRPSLMLQESSLQRATRAANAALH